MEHKIKIQDKEFSITRLTLKGWTKLGGLREEIEEAISKKDTQKYFESVVCIIEMASSPSPTQIKWEEVPWVRFMEIFDLCVEINHPTIKFPVLEDKKEKKEKLPWEYRGRAWYFWLNLFAKNYGWDENKIEHLDIDTALGLYQEIQIESQLRQEWEYGLSEIAYPYNKATKTQEFKPLDRPYWMLPIAPKPMIIKIRKDMYPEGNVIILDEEEKKKRGI